MEPVTASANMFSIALSFIVLLYLQRMQLNCKCVKTSRLLEYMILTNIALIFMKLVSTLLGERFFVVRMVIAIAFDIAFIAYILMVFQTGCDCAKSIEFYVMTTLYLMYAAVIISAVVSVAVTATLCTDWGHGVPEECLPPKIVASTKRSRR